VGFEAHRDDTEGPTMLTDFRRTPGRLAALVLLVAAGCGPSRNEHYVPSAAAAREALVAALDSWRAGRPPGRIEDRTPPVEVVDSKWKGGEKLAAYEITAEETNADGHRSFTVKLTLAEPAREQEVHFVVLGIDPLWVYRDEDYVKLSGM
jgi:hypothetical protein